MSALYHYFFGSQLECWAFVTSLVGVWLMTRQWLIAWPAGLISVVLYAIVFVEYQLYADASLQVFFFAMLAYGWWHWKHPQPGRRELPTSHTSLREWGGYLLLTVVATLAIAQLLLHATDSKTPYWDASTTAMSLAAQWMQARKQIENWIVWIVADLSYIGLYYYKDLKATSILSAIYCVLAVLGYLQWRKVLRHEAAATAPSAA